MWDSQLQYQRRALGAHFLMLRTRSAAAGSFIFSRNSLKLRVAVPSANAASSAITGPVIGSHFRGLVIARWKGSSGFDKYPIAKQ